MAQWKTVLATESNNLTSFPGTLVAKVENLLLQGIEISWLTLCQKVIISR